jgi:hypothetical protein
MSEQPQSTAPTPFQWLESHYDEIANQQGSWAKVAERMTADGVLDRDGKPPLPDAVRVTWFRVRKLREGQTAGPRDVRLPLPGKTEMVELPPPGLGQWMPRPGWLADNMMAPDPVPAHPPATSADITRLEGHLVKISQLLATREAALSTLGPDVLRAVRIVMAHEYRRWGLAAGILLILTAAAGFGTGIWYRGEPPRCVDQAGSVVCLTPTWQKLAR